MKVAEVFAHDLVERAKANQHLQDMIIKDDAQSVSCWLVFWDSRACQARCKVWLIGHANN